MQYQPPNTPLFFAVRHRKLNTHLNLRGMQLTPEQWDEILGYIQGKPLFLELRV